MSSKNKKNNLVVEVDNLSDHIKTDIGQLASLLKVANPDKLPNPTSKPEQEELFNELHELEAEIGEHIDDLQKISKELQGRLDKVGSGQQSTRVDDIKERAIRHNLQEGMVVVDDQYCIVFMNDSAQEILGYNFREVKGRSYFEVVRLRDSHDNDIPYDKRPMRLSMTTGEKVTIVPVDRYYGLRKDGSKFAVVLSTSPVMERGKIVGGTLLFHELMPRDDIGTIDFIALASHQIRTPLTVANLHVDMLLAGYLGKLTEDQRQALEQISFHNYKMSEVLGEFLTASRIEMGTFKVNPHSMDIVVVIESVVKAFVSDFRFKNLKYSAKCPKNLPNIYADSDVVGLILHNILSNAVKYSEPGGEIRLEVKKQKDRLVLSVADDGCGIPADEQDKIFERFYRGSNSLKSKTSGVGFGLHIVEKLLELCTGEISFESVEGKGTTFYVSYPTVQVNGAKQGAAEFKKKKQKAS
jgi:PAS domain S-box-containing protein